MISLTSILRSAWPARPDRQGYSVAFRVRASSHPFYQNVVLSFSRFVLDQPGLGPRGSVQSMPWLSALPGQLAGQRARCKRLISTASRCPCSPCSRAVSWSPASSASRARMPSSCCRRLRLRSRRRSALWMASRSQSGVSVAVVAALGWFAGRPGKAGAIRPPTRSRQPALVHWTHGWPKRSLDAQRCPCRRRQRPEPMALNVSSTLKVPAVFATTLSGNTLPSLMPADWQSPQLTLQLYRPWVLLQR